MASPLSLGKWAQSDENLPMVLVLSESYSRDIGRNLRFGQGLVRQPFLICSYTLHADGCG